MINSLTIHSGKAFTNKLYHHQKKDVTYTFSDGLNIITGRNGSGKSVLLKIIKTLCGISEDNTYATSPSPMDIHPLFSNKWYTMPEYISKTLKNKEYPNATLDWDGSLTQYLTPDYFNPRNLWNALDNPFPNGGDNLFSGIETIAKLMSNDSKGEDSIRILIKLNELRTRYNNPCKNGNDLWMNADKVFQDWIGTFPKNGKPTLLIDELDTHLDLDNQNAYWGYISHLTKKWQVIVVSHSIFAFKLVENVNHVPLQKEYFNKVNKLL